MGKFLTGLFFVSLAAGLLYVRSPIQYYTTPKQERLYQLWQKDFSQLSADPKFQKVFSNLSKIEVHFTDPQVAEEFEKFKTPFKVQNSGGYILKISITRWIEAKNYGFVIQHELFDQNQDKIYEFGRTYKVGLIL